MKIKNELYELLTAQAMSRSRDNLMFLYFDSRGGMASVDGKSFVRDLGERMRDIAAVPEDRLGIWGYNSYEWVLTALAAIITGKHLILFDPNLSDNDMKGLCHGMDTEGLLADGELKDEAARLFPGMPVYGFGSGEGMSAADGNAPAGMTDTCKATGDFICFTSGTSQNSKGVVISAHALYTCACMARGLLCGGPGDRYYLPLPLHHIYGFTMLFHILEDGGTVCLHRGARYLQKDLLEFNPKYAFFVPSMLHFLLKSGSFPEGLSGVYTGGGYCRPEYEAELKEKGITLINLYGLSETLGAVCYSTVQKGCSWMRPFGEISFSLSNEGEILMHLPFHMDGYYKNPGKTAEVLSGDEFCSGDAGEVDADGFICVRGRMRDTLVLENGEKVYAEDVDNELAAIPGTSEAGTFLYEGGLIAAVVPDGSLDEEACREAWNRWNQQRSRNQKINRLWIRKKALPRTTTGKLKRFELAGQYAKWAETQH